jgi:hypothetical protein
LYGLLIVVGVLAFTFLFKYLKVKKVINFDVDDLIEISGMFGLGVDLVNEMGLKYDKQIKLIAAILKDTLDYACKVWDDSADMSTVAYNYAVGLADKFGLVLTDSRKDIIKKLIDIGIEKSIVKIYRGVNHSPIFFANKKEGFILLFYWLLLCCYFF